MYTRMYKLSCAAAKSYASAVNPCMMMCFFQDNKSCGATLHALILCPHIDD
jgi:hypothetical protein